MTSITATQTLDGAEPVSGLKAQLRRAERLKK